MSLAFMLVMTTLWNLMTGCNYGSVQQQLQRSRTHIEPVFACYRHRDRVATAPLISLVSGGLGR